MKLKIHFLLFLIFCCFMAKSQISTQQNQIDTTLAKKITLSGFCLCSTTLSDLKNLDSELKSVEVEEMDMCKDGFVQDSRFVNRKGYYSKKYPGIIFQKDNNNEFISKIRLTKDFIGKLPDGNYINMNTLSVKDVLKIYPGYNTWKSRGCSDYWNLTNDTLSFFVEIDKNKKPQYPVDEAYYLDKGISGIDLSISCYSISHKKDEFILFPPDEPMFFLDSIRVNKGALNLYEPNEIALVSVYKDSNATKITGKDAKSGVIYITTKSFARDSYWKYFNSKSFEYQQLVPDMKMEAKVIYILNDKVLRSNFEGDLFNINDSNFIELSVVNDSKLKRDYNIKDNSIGVIIKTITK